MRQGMINRVQQISAIMIWGGFATSLFAIASPAANAESKPRYAVVDMQAVILSVAEGKNARARLEKEIQEKQKDFAKKKQELDKLNKEWEQQAALLSESAKAKKQKEFQEKFLALKNEEMNFQASIKRKEQKATSEIANKVAKLVEKMAQEKDLEIVFEYNTAGLLYVKNPLNLTSEVISAYEKAYKKTSGVAKKAK